MPVCLLSISPVAGRRARFRGLLLTALTGLLTVWSEQAPARTPDGRHKVVIVAGRPSHPPRMHEFNAGTKLLARCLREVPGLHVEFTQSGWPKDETLFDGADAVVFYMDGGGGHEVVQENGRRMRLVDEWAARGVGIGCMHYGVEIVPQQAGPQFHRWIGGYYENSFSCNPIWEPRFEKFLDHPVTRGVKPFQVKDEWYFNMRFVDGFSAAAAAKQDNVEFWPILVARPGDAVRNGPYVYPRGPYPHIQEAKGREEAMMWAVQRADGGRGFGFTGGHFHDNWANDEFRRVVLNGIVWLAGAEVPEGGVASTLEPGEIDQNLDPKPPRK